MMKYRWRHRNKIQKKWTNISLVALLLGAVFFLLTLSNVYTETYNIERFSNSKETIRSPITVENEKETERKTREAVQAVEDRYNVSDEITQERVDFVSELFDAVAKLDEKDKRAAKQPDLKNQDKVQNLQQILSPAISKEIDQQTLKEIIQSLPNERAMGKELLTTSLYDVLNEGVRLENVETAKEDLAQKFRYSSLDNEFKKALISLSEFAVVQNSFFDVEKTLEARKQAANNIEPVMLRAGEVIVRKGQTITNENYEQIKLAGLLNNDRNIYPIFGLFIFVFLLVGVLAFEIHTFFKNNKLDNGKLASVLLISLMVILLMKLVSFFASPMNQFFLLVPATTGAIMLKILLNERLAMVSSGVYAVMGSLIFNSAIPGSLNMEAGVYFFLSQIAGVIFLRNVKDRIAILKAGIAVMAVNVLTVLLFLFLSFEKYTLIDTFIQGGFAIFAAFLSVVLAIGLLPFFEAGLGLLSDAKLLALSSPNHPLLRKILIESPGTYHHSVMVANLSETACEAIGANGLLARVAAYYHDLGKTVRPNYFIENQMGMKNPHDMLPPKQSADIIISHPYDGAQQLKKEKLPKEIIDVAEQHHGTTLLKYFYYKEKEQNKNVKEEDYRYPGPKPQSKEAAIVCICDSVEAAVRSLNEPTKGKIKEIVQSIINDRLMDGQLSESPLTLNELEIIRTTVCETLQGIFHSRIQYPKQDELREVH